MIRNYRPGDTVRIRGFKAIDGYAPPIQGTVVRVFTPDDGRHRAVISADDGTLRHVTFDQLEPTEARR